MEKCSVDLKLVRGSSWGRESAVALNLDCKKQMHRVDAALPTAFSMPIEPGLLFPSKSRRANCDICILRNFEMLISSATMLFVLLYRTSILLSLVVCDAFQPLTTQSKTTISAHAVGNCRKARDFGQNHSFPRLLNATVEEISDGLQKGPFSSVDLADVSASIAAAAPPTRWYSTNSAPLDNSKAYFARIQEARHFSTLLPS